MNPVFLYVCTVGHRVGCLLITVADKEEKARLESQLKVLARACYSNPPIHGARIVTKILSNPATKNQWCGFDVRNWVFRLLCSVMCMFCDGVRLRPVARYSFFERTVQY